MCTYFVTWKFNCIVFLTQVCSSFFCPLSVCLSFHQTDWLYMYMSCADPAKPTSCDVIKRITIAIDLSFYVISHFKCQCCVEGQYVIRDLSDAMSWLSELRRLWSTWLYTAISKC